MNLKKVAALAVSSVVCVALATSAFAAESVGTVTVGGTYKGVPVYSTDAPVYLTEEQDAELQQQVAALGGQMVGSSSLSTEAIVDGVEKSVEHADFGGEKVSLTATGNFDVSHTYKVLHLKSDGVWETLDATVLDATHLQYELGSLSYTFYVDLGANNGGNTNNGGNGGTTSTVTDTAAVTAAASTSPTTGDNGVAMVSVIALFAAAGLAYSMKKIRNN